MKKKRLLSLLLCIIISLSNSFLVLANSTTKSIADNLYDKKEDVPKADENGNALTRIEEVVDKNDKETLEVIINHPFKYNEKVNHLITKRLNPNFHEPESPGNLRWDTVVYAYDGKNRPISEYTNTLNYYTDIWSFDYKIEMALISTSGTAKFTDGALKMNGRDITPYLVDGSIPTASAYVQGPSPITEAWENACWNSNKPIPWEIRNNFNAPQLISNSKGKYKFITGNTTYPEGEIYLPNAGNKYTLPNTFNQNAGVYPNYVGYYGITVDKPDSQLQKGIYGHTNYKAEYGRVKYKGIYGSGGGTPGGGGGGEITFTPYETEWTNKGKTSEGVGAYPVLVEYKGDNPVVQQGTATVHHSEPQPPLPPAQPGGSPIPQPNKEFDYTIPFDVKFNLQSITVTGATNETISGPSGTVNIRKEGENLQLQAVGTWKSPEYTLPGVGAFESITSTVIPPTPAAPTGTSGYYDIDWTKANINLQKASSVWINNPVPYPVSISVTDNLSGFANGDNVTVSDSSHYGNNAQDSLPYSAKSYNKTVWLDDGIYSISVKADDRATNESSDSSSTYLIDGTDPVVNFNVKPKIFNEENGAVRKNSIKGIDFAYFGRLTASDNLSGVAKIQYKWTYGNSKPSSGYEVIYTSPYTYHDRYQETIDREIEKPVGDNQYLHAEIWDTAGNYTYQSFGPYEDPIKLRDFQVTDVRDPRWKSVFWNDEEYKSYKGRTFKVNELPIDDKSHPTLKNAFPKKGYAFYFDITSEFLYRENDRIEVKPIFYYVKDGQRIRVDCYYDNNNNPLVGFGSPNDNSAINLNTARYGDVLIGNHSKLVLTKGTRITKGREWENYDGIKGWKDEIQYRDGKIQWWYGKYFIPATTVFVKTGDSPRPENILKGGNIIVNFEIIAYKNGVETFSTDQIFSYNLKQWQLEGGPKNSDYRVGDVIVFNAKYSALSDYSVRVIQ